PPWQPRRWGRPLAVGLALALVATLMPGAGADDSGTPAESGIPEPGTLAAAVAEAEAMTETFQTDPREAEASASPERTSADGEPGTDTAELAQGTGSRDRAGGQQEQPTREPVVVAELEQAGQPRDGQPDLAAGDAAGATGRESGGDQDAAATATRGAGIDGELAAGRPGEPGTVGQAKAGDGPGGCTSGCSTRPPAAGDAAVAAAGGWSLRGVWERARELLERGRAEAAQPPAPEESGRQEEEPPGEEAHEPAREEAHEPAERPLAPPALGLTR